MLAKRIVACLDICDGRTVKGTRFSELRDVGSPEALARQYCDQHIDEMVVLDVSATLDGRPADAGAVQRIARAVNVPLTVGGGVRTLNDIELLLEAGADKVAINSAALRDPSILGAAARRFGRQCIVASIDALHDGCAWTVYARSGTTCTTRDVIAWAQEAASRGAGEILLTSIDRDGMRRGFDLALTRTVSDSVPVPVVASGGACSAESFAEVLSRGGADAALGASVFHFGALTVADVKACCSQSGILVRS